MPLERLFQTIRDESFTSAKKIIERSSLESLQMCHQPQDHTTVFFAAARSARFRQADRQAMSLCQMLVARGIPVNHTDEMNQTALFFAARQGHADTIRYLMSQGADPNVVDTNGETALFYAVRRLRTDAAKALLEGGANLEVVNKAGNTCMSVAPAPVFLALQEERKKRRLYDSDSGAGPKRQRTAMEALRAWASEWPAKEPNPRNKQVNYKQEDIINKTDSYAVLGKCPKECAAQLRISEKNFVADHARFFEKQPWFEDLSPEEWCQSVGVIADEEGVAVEEVLAGNRPYHFTLPLLELKSMCVAGYIHAQWLPETNELYIAALKVNEEHTRQGLGKLLLAAAELHSRRIGWECTQTSLAVLKTNERALNCYAKARFCYESSGSAQWGKKMHVASDWQRWKKVHKHVYSKKAPAARACLRHDGLHQP